MKTMQAPIVKMIEATAVAKFEIPGHQIIQDVNGVRLRAKAWVFSKMELKREKRQNKCPKPQEMRKWYYALKLLYD